MALEQYVYTNFHELNLDWILQTVKSMNSRISEYLSDENLTVLLTAILESHPEWTSTVADGSVGYVKLDSYLQNIVDEILAMLDKDLRITFLSNNGLTGMDNNNYTGLSVLIQTENKVGIYDFGNDVTQSALLKVLNDRNITSVDFAIISHYHADHIGGANAAGLIYLLDEIDFSNCTFYLPHNLIDWSSFTGVTYAATENLVKNALISRGISIVYPVENQVINVDNASIKFNNLSTYMFNQYYNILLSGGQYEPGVDTSYNNFCMIATIIYGNSKTLLTADLEEKSEELNARNIEDINIYQVEHHGVNLRTDETYVSKINPDIAVIAELHVDGFYQPYSPVSLGAVHAKDCGAVIYNTNKSGNVDIRINGFGGYTVNCDTDVIQPMYQHDSTLYFRQIIPLNTDLDDLKEPGCYWCPNAAYAAQLTNVPTQVAAFTLQVISTSGNAIVDSLMQIIIPSSTNNERIYIRGYSSGNYLPWKVTGLIPIIDDDTIYTAPAVLSNYASITRGGYVKAGNVCYVDLTVKLLSAFSNSAWTSFLADFPVPLKNSYTIMATFNQTTRTTMTQTGIISSGNMAINNVAANDVIQITGTYLCKM